ncbi:MAG: hypothetical protein AB1453_00445, partial [Chloroflexota bacterium]
MKIWLRNRYWTFAILGILGGIVYTYMHIHGLIAGWQLAGKPGEEIVRILGFSGRDRVIVETESGKFFSLRYSYYAKWDRFLPNPVVWTEEMRQDIEVQPASKPFMKFISPPLFFKVKQFYEMAFPQTEGETVIRCVLSEDGNLWMWKYGQGGMAII